MNPIIAIVPVVLGVVVGAIVESKFGVGSKIISKIGGKTA